VLPTINRIIGASGLSTYERKADINKNILQVNTRGVRSRTQRTW